MFYLLIYLQKYNQNNNGGCRIHNAQELKTKNYDDIRHVFIVLPNGRHGNKCERHILRVTPIRHSVY
jgi:hypothetical protein